MIVQINETNVPLDNETKISLLPPPLVPMTNRTAFQPMVIHLYEKLSPTIYKEVDVTSCSWIDQSITTFTSTHMSGHWNSYTIIRSP